MTGRTNTHRLGATDEGGAAPAVEADDVHLGGERNQGRGTAGKARVIAACERHVGGRWGSSPCRGLPASPAKQSGVLRDFPPPARHGAHGRPQGLQRPRRGRTRPRRDDHPRQAPGTPTQRAVPCRQHPGRQPGHRAEGHPRSGLGQAPGRPSRRLLLDHEPPPRHAGAGSGAMPSGCRLLPHDTQVRLPVTG